MVEIIAHRGASGEHLENTRRAFEAAIAQDADGVELDVHRTRDGQVVVHHDFHVRDDTGRLLAIADLAADELRKLRLSNGETVPTLDEVLDLTHTRVVAYIEVKGANLEQDLVACLDRHPTARIAVHSFDHRIASRVRELRPGTSIGLLSASYPVDLTGFIGPVRPDALWQQSILIDQALVRASESVGARVIAWTENDPARARQLMREGVSAICTDTPGKMREALSAT
jgi:glycerophosphoryl diester phosphodiesterase